MRTVATLMRNGNVSAGQAIAETNVHAIYEPPRPRASVTARPTECATR